MTFYEVMRKHIWAVSHHSIVCSVILKHTESQPDERPLLSLVTLDLIFHCITADTLREEGACAVVQCEPRWAVIHCACR